MLLAEDRLPADVDGVFSILVHVNFGINPVLYFVFKRDYRRLMRKWFAAMCVLGQSLQTRGCTDLTADCCTSMNEVVQY